MAAKRFVLTVGVLGIVRARLCACSIASSCAI
jgi:hypothetical protein